MWEYLPGKANRWTPLQSLRESENNPHRHMLHHCTAILFVGCVCLIISRDGSHCFRWSTDPIYGAVHLSDSLESHSHHLFTIQFRVKLADLFALLWYHKYWQLIVYQGYIIVRYWLSSLCGKQTILSSSATDMSGKARILRALVKANPP